MKVSTLVHVHLHVMLVSIWLVMQQHYVVKMILKMILMVHGRSLYQLARVNELVLSNLISCIVLGMVRILLFWLAKSLTKF